MENEIVVSPTTCAFCAELETKTCERCNKLFCKNHVSKISPIFCIECFAQVTLIIDNLTKRDSEWDMFEDCLVERKSTARTLRLDGPDWVWYSAIINNLNEDEFKTMFEFHRFIISLMEHVNDIRKVEKNALLKGQKIVLGITQTTTTKTVRKAKQVSLEEVLRKQGLPEAVVQAMLKAAGEIK
jgi:hypothetical protein